MNTLRALKQIKRACTRLQSNYQLTSVSAKFFAAVFCSSGKVKISQLHTDRVAVPMQHIMQLDDIPQKNVFETNIAMEDGAPEALL